MSELQQGWAAAPLGDILDILSGFAFKSSEYAGSGHFLIRIGNVQDGLITQDNPKFVQLSPSTFRFELKAGDILTSLTGNIGRVARIEVSQLPAALNQRVAKLTLDTVEIDTSYVYRFLNSAGFRKRLNAKGQGAAQQNVSPKAILEIELNVAPLPEQRRIVAKIDSLTGKSRRARDHLDHITRLVEKYKQAILAAAFRGDLTRSLRGEAATPKSSFPAGWHMRALGEISEIQGGIQVGKKRPAGSVLFETPYLRVANVQRGWLKLDEIKTLGVTEEERQRLTLQAGDILMNEGGDRDKLGRGWVWQGEVAGCIHQNHVFRIRLQDTGFPPEFVSHYANEFGQPYFIDQGTQTTNLASISKRRVAALPVPIPPVDEAKEIVRLIENAFAWIDRLAADAISARKLIDHLDQSVLAKAFKGELVPQDPADEPASALLDRIRAERAATPKAKHGRKKAA